VLHLRGGAAFCTCAAEGRVLHPRGRRPRSYELGHRLFAHLVMASMNCTR
jgi:hypothetical protein